MAPNDQFNISFNLQSTTNNIASSAYARQPREGSVLSSPTKDSPAEDVYTKDAYRLELTKQPSQAKEPVDYSKRKVFSGGTSHDATPPVIKVRVPLNEVIVVSLKPKEEPEPTETLDLGAI